nr:orf283 [Zancudomyces culisetae]AAW49510.1 orf283 [Zancudomyces culisetae]
IYQIMYNLIENNLEVSQIVYSIDISINDMLSITPIYYYGPYIYPKFFKKPIRIYSPKLDRNLIGVENRKRIIIYQWINLINGKIYIGSSMNGSTRLLSYWTTSVLKKNLPIYNNLKKYGHNNFTLAILEDLGFTGSVNKSYLLNREQFYLNILFTEYSSLKLNCSPTAGSTFGFKHKDSFKSNRTGELNPMFGKTFSTQFINMQIRNKVGKNNPQFGKKKSSETIAKLIKLVYVYDFKNKKFIGSYSTIDCIKKFKIGSDTLKKYIKNGLPYKNLLFSRIKLY